MKSSLASFALLSVLVTACGLDELGSAPDKPSGSGGAPAGSGAAGPVGSGPGPGAGSTASGGGMGGVGGTGGGMGAGGVGPGTGGAGGTGGTGGGSPTCPAGKGAEMVLIKTAAGAYCVDSTEVTAQQYKDWLDSGPSLPKMNDELCGWKFGDSYDPRKGGHECAPEHYDPANKPDHPVVCIDWCDAREYCSSVGKRLCGARDGGGPIDFDTPKTANVDELTYACSEGWNRTYPYGNSFDEKACVGDLYDGMNNGETDSADPVKSAAGCQGGFPGLHDMVGNVWEWENSCKASGNALDHMCGARGGSFWDDDMNELRCESMWTNFKRSYYNKNIGFRCCAAAIPAP